MDKFKYLQEITSDWNTDYRVPLHIYILNSKNQIVGYIKEGTTTVHMFSRPSSFDKKFRKFKTLNPDKLKVTVDKNKKVKDNNVKPNKKGNNTLNIDRGQHKMNKLKTLNWNDRFALIEHFKPSNKETCEIFDVTMSELKSATSMKDNGVLVPTKDLDYNSYAGVFNKQSSSTSTSKPSTNKEHKPLTATKHKKQPKKRGRKGTNIAQAFKVIPETPVSAEQFAKDNNVSIAVLRQSKRFDTSNQSGQVKVRKNKETNTLMIWREKNT